MKPYDGRGSSGPWRKHLRPRQEIRHIGRVRTTIERQLAQELRRDNQQAAIEAGLRYDGEDGTMSPVMNVIGTQIMGYVRS